MVHYIGDGTANFHSGTAFKDTLEGLGGNDTLLGNASNDSILGGDDNDSIGGGAGKDTVLGGLGADILDDHNDNDLDYLYGNEGNDFVYGAGKDFLQGGADNDYLGLYLVNLGALNVDLSALTSGGTITFASTTISGFEQGFILFGTGNDKVRAPSMNLQITGGGGADTLLGGTGGDELHGGGDLTNDADVLKGFEGNDILFGGIGDRIDGGDGTNDTVELYMQNTTGDWVVNLGAMAGGGTVNMGFGTQVTGCERGLMLFGSGDDQIKLGMANVRIFAGNGNDTLIGGDGDDNLEGDDGDDVIKGGLGYDVASYQSDFGGAVTVDLNITGYQATGGSGMDRLEDIEGLYGTNMGDKLTGDAGDNGLEGYSGADTLIGGLGNDTLNGGSGGSTDVDRLSGGAGQDTYNGGNGNDVLVWLSTSHTTVAAPDLIQGLAAGDVISLAGIDADTTQEGDQAFTIVLAFSSNPGELAKIFTSGFTHFVMDVDGDGVADADIIAAGDQTAHASFVL